MSAIYECDGMKNYHRLSGDFHSRVPKQESKTWNIFACVPRVLGSGDNGDFDGTCFSPCSGELGSGRYSAHLIM